MFKKFMIFPKTKVPYSPFNSDDVVLIEPVVVANTDHAFIGSKSAKG